MVGIQFSEREILEVRFVTSNFMGDRRIYFRRPDPTNGTPTACCKYDSRLYDNRPPRALFPQVGVKCQQEETVDELGFTGFVTRFGDLLTLARKVLVIPEVRLRGGTMAR